ncbi:MAG TPA: polysaccharide biosynthesis C-terminal domain-containing protein, partial [Gemmatimonadaceae bacterium]|nr:polysaccharide biosynthesis C-terminal domain-containing protein [Gemmatimonadaceae bacterium]
TASMMGMNRHRGLIPVFLADAACNVVLSVLLVPRFGVVGSALGTVIPQIVVTMFVGPWYVRRELGIPLSTFWLNAHVRPILAILPFAAVSYYVERSWQAPNLIVYFTQIVLTLPFAALGAWVVGLTQEERRKIASLFARRVLATR